MATRVTSVRLTEEADTALLRLSAGTGKDRSEVIRELILAKAEKRAVPPDAAGMDLPTAKRLSLSLMDSLALVATALETQDRESAIRMVRILENRLRNWREDRQTPDEQMDTALEHVFGVMARLPAKKRAKVMAGAVERMQERFQ